MKKTTKSFVLALALIASTFSMASGSLSDYPQYKDLINNDNLIIYSYWGCLDEGYTLNESVVDPIYYIAIPQGEHTAATVTLRLSKKIGGPYSLTTAYITYTIQIIDNGNGALRIGEMTVDRSVVY